MAKKATKAEAKRQVEKVTVFLRSWAASSVTERVAAIQPPRRNDGEKSKTQQHRQSVPGHVAG